MLHRAARNAYSWWWASHIRTKQSKWLDENLQDMEEKVEYILKIIDEDGDSFAKRAEMYYRKRPELVNFVEDSFRGYRALAERYDHLSKELQTANRTIATVFPEQVQLAMDEEDEENLSTIPSSSSSGLRKPTKDLPAVPSLSIPKIPKPSQRNKKMPSRLMSKKGLIKTSIPEATTSTTNRSGLSKVEALEEIDDLQKRILGLQTEKEFVKSSYESGLTKYWEIENRVTEMQAKVCSLQDEFGIGTVIEDDEARTIMAATALKSCQETLIRLQEKQEQSNEEAKVEYQRIKEAREKFETLEKQLSKNTTNGQEFYEKYESVTTSPESNNLDQQVHELELLRERIKEQLQENSSTSLSMSELAEKIDEVVEKVITLETAISSQTALVNRLRSETNELHSHLQSQEDDKESLIEGSESKSNRIKELEQELHRVQNLNRSVKTQNENLQIHFTEASVNLDYISENLESVKPDEEVQNMVLFTESRGVQHNSKISRDVKTKEEGPEQIIFAKAEDGNYMQLNPSNHRFDRSQNDQERFVPHVTPENLFDGNENMMGLGRVDQNAKPIRGLEEEALGEFSLIPKNVRLEEEAKQDYSRYDSSPFKSEEENFVQPNLRNHSDALLVNGEVRVVPDAKPEEGFEENKNARMEEIAEKHNILNQSSSVEAQEENCVQSGVTNQHENKMSPSLDSVIGEFVKIEEGEKKEGFHTHNPLKVEEEESLLLSDPFSHLDSHAVKGERTVFDVSLDKGSNDWEHLMSSGSDSVNSKDEKMTEEANFVQSYPNNPFDDVYPIDEVRTSLDANKEEMIKGGEEIMGPTHNSMISKDMIMGEEKKADFPNHNPFEENFDQYNTGIQLDNLQYANPEKYSKDHDDMMASGNDPEISVDAKPEEEEEEEEEEEKKKDVQDHGASVEAKEERKYVHSNQSNHMNDLSERDQEQEKEELEIDDEDQPNWRQLFLNGLEDREKVLLEQYTSILRNYKETKKKLSEVEKKDRDSNFKSSMHIKELKNANALKDMEIQSLQKKLKLFQEDIDETPEPSLAELSPSPQEGERKLRGSSFRVVEISSPNSDQNKAPNMLEQGNLKSMERKEELIAQDNAKSPSADELHEFSTVEEKFRMDIDGLLEENIEFWLRFSTSFHQIQKFQTSVQDLQAELVKLKDNKKHDGSTKHQTLNSDVRPIYRHMREIRTELALWLEHNALLEDDLHNRFSSLCNIQEEISRLSNAGFKAEETELGDYQAGKFQGEILNMKLENSKVADELQAGLERVKGLQVEIERTLLELEEELGISGSKTHHSNTKNSSSRSRIPLRSFLFGVRLRKQNKSIFACMSPALQKQYSDLSALQT